MTENFHAIKDHIDQSINIKLFFLFINYKFVRMRNFSREKKDCY